MGRSRDAFARKMKTMIVSGTEPRNHHGSICVALGQFLFHWQFNERKFLSFDQKAIDSADVLKNEIAPICRQYGFFIARDNRTRMRFQPADEKIIKRSERFYRI